MAGRPDGDVWNIVDNDKDSQHYGRDFRLNFSYISSEEIKDVVKDYVWQNYRVGNKVLKRLYDEVQNHFKWFSMFADANRVTSLKGLDKAGIIIQSQTGLRINEVLSIQEGCVKRTADGYDYMEVTLGKTEKGEPIIHKVFINDLVKDAIAELTKHTAELRKESGLKELFIVRNHGIRALNVSKWVGQRLPHFIERHDIRDNKGELYPLTSHQFRATFVRELIKRKVPIAMIMKQYSHVSIEMTAHYLTLQEEEVKEIYSDMILSPETKIYSNLEPTMIYYEPGENPVDIVIGKDAVYYHPEAAQLEWSDDIQPFGYRGVKHFFEECERVLELERGTN